VFLEEDPIGDAEMFVDHVERMRDYLEAPAAQYFEDHVARVLPEMLREYRAAKRVAIATCARLIRVAEDFIDVRKASAARADPGPSISLDDYLKRAS